MNIMNPLRWLAKQLIGPDDDAPPGPDTLVTIGSSLGEAVAGLWSSTLEDSGIRCLVKSVGLPPYSMAAQTFDVQVQFKDFLRARAILRLDHDDPAEERA
jgi:hypothetical protein